MAKNKNGTVVVERDAETYRLNAETTDLLKGAGNQEQWTAKPKGQAFVVSCWMTPARRFLILQQYRDGTTNVFTEDESSAFCVQPTGG